RSFAHYLDGTRLDKVIKGHVNFSLKDWCSYRSSECCVLVDHVEIRLDNCLLRHAISTDNHLEGYTHVWSWCLKACVKKLCAELCKLHGDRRFLTIENGCFAESDDLFRKLSIRLSNRRDQSDSTIAVYDRSHDLSARNDTLQLLGCTFSLFLGNFQHYKRSNNASAFC